MMAIAVLGGLYERSGQRRRRNSVAWCFGAGGAAAAAGVSRYIAAGCYQGLQRCYGRSVGNGRTAGTAPAARSTAVELRHSIRLKAVRFAMDWSCGSAAGGGSGDPRGGALA